MNLVNNTHYDIKLSTASNWGKTISITPTSGAVNATVQIRYNPTAAGAQTDQISIASSGATTKILNLTGTATVPYNPNAPATIIGKIDNLIQFPVLKLNNTNTKSFNIKTTDITNSLTLALSGNDVSMFTVLPISLTKELVNAAGGTTITVTYKPTSIGIHSATLTISGGGLNPAKQISLQGEGK